MKTDPLTDPVADAERALDEELYRSGLPQFRISNVMALARCYAALRALAELEEVHRLTCHPSALEIAHGVEGFEHDIQHHVDFAVEHGTEADVWVVRREALEKEIANAH